MKGGKRQSGIHIHLTNRWLYTFIAIGILIAIGVGVYAYGTSTPSTFGHTLDELARCAEGDTIITSGGHWACTPSSSIRKGSLVYKLHTVCNDDVFRGLVDALVLQPNCFVESWVNYSSPSYGCTYITFTQTKREVFCGGGTTPYCGTLFNYSLYRCPNTPVGYMIYYP